MKNLLLSDCFGVFLTLVAEKSLNAVIKVEWIDYHINFHCLKMYKIVILDSYTTVLQQNVSVSPASVTQCNLSFGHFYMGLSEQMKHINGFHVQYSKEDLHPLKACVFRNWNLCDKLKKTQITASTDRKELL